MLCYNEDFFFFFFAVRMVTSSLVLENISTGSDVSRQENQTVLFVRTVYKYMVYVSLSATNMRGREGWVD